MKLLQIFLIIFLFISCGKNDKPQVRSTKTEYVVIIVIDGPRISETWDEPNRQYIPNQKRMLSEGSLVHNFRNNGPTWTMCGHSAIVTGRFGWISNSGSEIASNPTIFQQYRKQQNIPAEKVWMVTSKGKIEALSNCSKEEWFNKYRPFTNCGIDGLGAPSGYRDDSTTYEVARTVLRQFHPNLLLINFREPDYSGHQANWNNYIKGIKDTDRYIGQIWKQIQKDPVMRNKTSLFITYDHGRHLDSIADGFVSHGDACEGCRHLALLALGPDFKKNAIIENTYKQIDLAKTVGFLLKFGMPESNGEVIYELLDS